MKSLTKKRITSCFLSIRFGLDCQEAISGKCKLDISKPDIAKPNNAKPDPVKPEPLKFDVA